MQHRLDTRASDSATVDRFQLLLDFSSDAIAEFDRSFQYVAANEAWANLMGISVDQLLHQTHESLIQRFHGSTRCITLGTAVQSSLDHVLAQGVPYRATHLLDQASVEISYTPIAASDASAYRIFAIGRLHAPASSLPEQETPGHASEAAITPPSRQSCEAPAIVGAEMPGMEEVSLDEVLAVPASRLSEGNREGDGGNAFLNQQDVPSEQDVPSNEDACPQPSRLSSEPAPHLDHQATELEKKQATQFLSNAEFLQLVLDSIPQYIFWKDQNSVYLGCNRRWAEMSGVGDPQNAIGMTEDDLPWTEEQRDWYLKCDRQVMDSGIPMLGIKQSQRQADGKITWRETSKIPIRDADGTIVGILGAIEDVTERKQAEDLLKRSKEKYQKLAKREELLNQLSSQIRNSLELKTIFQTVVREVRQLLDTDRVVIYRFDADWRGTVVTEDVIAPWISTLGEMGADNCFPEGFAVLYSQGRVRSIPDIRASGLDECHQQYLAKLQVQANLIVPILINQKLWGLLIAHHCRDTRDWQETEIDLLKYLAEQVGVAIRQGEIYAQAKDSAEQAQAQAEQLEKTLQELKQAQAQLIQTEKMSSLGQLVAGVAHEINNPVNFIYGNIDHIDNYVSDLLELVNLYQTRYPEPGDEINTALEDIDLEFLVTDAAKIFQSLRIGAQRIRQIVLSLRNFSRLDEAECKPVDIHEGIDSTLLILQHRLKPLPERPEIQVIKHYGTLPDVECYPSQLNQVFMNILSNAIDALEDCFVAEQDSAKSPLDEMAITIKTKQVGNRAQISIHNNGAHIPKAVYQKLFAPFFTTKPIGKGTGLGLSISQQIVVQKHQGNLKCHSAPGKGVEFCIDIPIKQKGMAS
jgi:PAS domain S-box-containing protein